MGLAFIYMQMVKFMKENLKMVKDLDQVNSFILTAVFMMETGQKIKKKVKEFYNILKKINMMVNEN